MSCLRCKSVCHVRLQSLRHGFAVTPQLRFAAQPSVHPKGTCFAASTGPPHRGRRGAFRACGRGGAMRASPPTDGNKGCVRETAGGVEPRPYAYLRDFTTGGQGRPPLRITRSAVNRGVGEIGEAPPVAEEASRFRGSAPIGGHNSGWESGGTTVGNRRPLRKVT